MLVLNGKSLKDYLLRAELPKIHIIGRFEPFGKDTCQVCDYKTRTDTFTTKAGG